MRRVRFIKAVQELGFSLAEIWERLSLRATARTRCTEIRQRTEAKVKAIEAKTASLQAMKQVLAKLVAECSGDGLVTACPILQSSDAGTHH